MWHAGLVLCILLVGATRARAQQPDVQRRAEEVTKREFYWRSLYNNVPDAKSFLDLIEGLGLFPAGLPPATTLLLPTNKAMQKMLADSGFNSPEELVEAMPQIEDDVAPKLVAFALHHIIPSGALTGGQLAEKERIATALEAAPQLIVDLATSLDGSGGAYFLSDGAGSRATILGSIQVGDSIGHLVDSVVLPEIGGLLHCPAANFSDAIAAVAKVPELPASAIDAARRSGAAASEADGDAAVGAAAAVSAGPVGGLEKPAITGVAVHLARSKLKKFAAVSRKESAGADMAY